MIVYNTGKTHKPPEGLGAGQWIGVEIECYMPFASLRRLGGGGNDARKQLTNLLYKYKIPNVTLKSDSSIDSPDHNRYLEIEINLLFNRNDYGPLERLCKLLKKLNTRVNRTCGLHVHLDCRDIGKRIERKPFIHHTVDPYGYSIPRTEYEYGPEYHNLMNRGKSLGMALPLMVKLVHKSRRRNTYCQVMEPRKNAGRYSAINLDSFDKFNTIEVRLHHGCIQFKRLKGWIEFLCLVSRRRPKNKIKNARDLQREIPDASREVLSYVRRTLRSAA